MVNSSEDIPEVWDQRERLEKIFVREPLSDKQHSWSQEEYSTTSSLLSEVMSITLHDVAFQPIFLGQGYPALMENYWDLVYEKGIQGCYLQTELGHSTNVARLETTSTHIPEIQEFEINYCLTNPSGGSVLWESSQLMVPSKQKDHKPLQGITVGDIGPKASGGMAAQDQGFVRFDHVRIPRTNMFLKFAQVMTQGDVYQGNVCQFPAVPPDKTDDINSSMIPAAGWTIAKAATVAILYTTVRREGEPDAKGLERQVLTYPSTYYRLMPILSRAFVFIELGRHTMKALTKMQQRLANRDTSLLPEMHALLCGLKVFVTTNGIIDIETARRSMGGHGYSAFAGLGTFYGQSHMGAGDPTQELRLAIKALCNEVLPNAIGLTNAFGFSDWSLDSALGVFDGRIYEALWQRVQMEPMKLSLLMLLISDPCYNAVKPLFSRRNSRADSEIANDVLEAIVIYEMMFNAM
ncbi:hypothetical protein BDR04DRAFT_1145422 [Suillus decipiens]|nr:hypothetical protein BDR04DRAFT_1145422 [Suillus decipiens]